MKKFTFGLAMSSLLFAGLAGASQETADIVGKTGSTFEILLGKSNPGNSSFSFEEAYLELGSAGGTKLSMGVQGNKILVMNLPAGESWVRVDLNWDRNYQGIRMLNAITNQYGEPPCDVDVAIEVGKVFEGSATAAIATHTIDCGDTPGYIELFGN